MRRDAIRDAGLRELGAHERLKRIAFDSQGVGRSYRERCRLLGDYKLELKKRRREVALECHPDKNREAPPAEREEKEDRFKRVTRAVDFLMTIIPRAPRPQPQVTVFPIFSGGGIEIKLGGQLVRMRDFRYFRYGSSDGTLGGVSTSSSCTANFGGLPWNE